MLANLVEYIKDKKNYQANINKQPGPLAANITYLPVNTTYRLLNWDTYPSSDDAGIFCLKIPQLNVHYKARLSPFVTLQAFLGF